MRREKAQKLMNYMMQSMETSRNILVLKDLLQYLQGKQTKIAAYVYDAIVFDFSKEDGKETLEEIQKIMESGGRYPIKVKHGKSLNF
jgi:predicted O-methyltransferase YrrM